MINIEKLIKKRTNQFGAKSDSICALYYFAIIHLK